MKSIFQSIASRGPWARVLLGVGGCAVVAALVLVWAPWSTKEIRTERLGGPEAPAQEAANADGPEKETTDADGAEQEAAEAVDGAKEPWPEIPTVTKPPKQKPVQAAEREKDLWVAPSGQPPTLGLLKQEAVIAAERTVKAFPDDPDSHALMGNACLFNGKGAEAVKSWRRCLELDPTRAGAYDGISLLAWQEGEFEEVVAACRNALKYDANMPDVHFRLGRALIELDRAAEAVAVAQEGAKRWSASDEAHLVLGQAYLQAEKYAEAQKCFMRVLEIDPERTRAHYGLATASARLGQRDKAKKHKARFGELIAAERDNLAVWTRDQSLSSEWSDQRARTAAIYAGAAGVYRKHGNAEQAERLLQRAAIIDPSIMRRR